MTLRNIMGTDLVTLLILQFNFKRLHRDLPLTFNVLYHLLSFLEPEI